MTTDYSSTHWDSPMYNDQDVADIFNEFLGKFVENMSEPDIDAERILEDNLWDLV